MAALASANSSSLFTIRRMFSCVPLVASAVTSQLSVGALPATTSAIAEPTTKNAPPAGAVPTLMYWRFVDVSFTNSVAVSFFSPWAVSRFAALSHPKIKITQINR